MIDAECIRERVRFLLAEVDRLRALMAMEDSSMAKKQQIDVGCGCHPPVPWEPPCDAPEYPPHGLEVCARHGVDPCHDDMWHLNNDRPLMAMEDSMDGTSVIDTTSENARLRAALEKIAEHPWTDSAGAAFMQHVAAAALDRQP